MNQHIDMNTMIRMIELLCEKMEVCSIVEVMSVMRRQTEQDGEIRDIIDYYPPWNPIFTYGFQKVFHEYMDHEWQVKRFEQFTGLKIEEIPVWDSQQALRERNPQKPHPLNVPCAYFKALVIPQPPEEGKKISGKNLVDRFIHAPMPQKYKAYKQPELTAFEARQSQGEKNGVVVDDGAQKEGKTSQNGNLTVADWKKRALDAVEADGLFGFDESMAHVLDTDVQTVTNVRTKVFPKDYDPLLNKAFAVGISAYMKERAEHNDHEVAKEKALAEFEKYLPDGAK